MTQVQAPGDKVTVTAFVAVSPADAFEVFTTEIDRWWRRGPAYRVAGRQPGVLHLEPRLGGRLFEESAQGAGAQGTLHEVGTITVWDPPSHLAFTWRAFAFVPGETTTVDIRFVARGDGTQVTLEHRGWAAIRGDHPVRHGKASAVFIAELGMWWASLLRALGAHATRERD